ncbi:hypothetical protein BaRGS_00014096 [Batillaria attramentaria]|uniref:Uncharacterized protein n=1 Tax=Batillaria attramentaria TaxID=370345 RepID=A0ABD0L5X5_9CAEN
MVDHDSAGPHQRLPSIHSLEGVDSGPPRREHPPLSKVLLSARPLPGGGGWQRVAALCGNVKKNNIFIEHCHCRRVLRREGLA